MNIHYARCITFAACVFMVCLTGVIITYLSH